MGDNVCCGLFDTIDCADDEHRHIGCGSATGVLDDTPVIDNDHARKYCLSEQFKECPYYPKQG